MTDMWERIAERLDRIQDSSAMEIFGLSMMGWTPFLLPRVDEQRAGEWTADGIVFDGSVAGPASDRADAPTTFHGRRDP
jgi:hypothetical protein